MLKSKNILAGAVLGAALSVSVASIGHADFNDAVTAYEAGDYTKAYNEWLPLAEARDPAAMRNIGHLYRRGLGVEQNFERAMHWYTRAATMGFDRAQANVATMYLKGEGVPQDYVKAQEWFAKAARNGHVISQYNLGLMYEHGKGVERSKSKALGWYNLAARAGHKQALNKLSILIAGNPDIKEDKPVVEKTKEPAQAAPQTAAVTPKAVAKTPVKSKPAEVEIAKTTPSPAKTPVVPKASVSEPVNDGPLTPESIGVAAGDGSSSPMTKKSTGSTPLQVVAPKSTATLKAPEEPVKTVTAEKPVIAEAPKKKFDPFAGSANNSATKGEATVFNKTADEKLKAEPEKEESKGFFAALSSLIAGDKETPAKPDVEAPAAAPAAAVATAVATPQVQDAPKITKREAAPVIEKTVKSAAPQQTIVAAKPPVAPVAAPAAQIPLMSTGAGLSLAERLEMADLAFTLQEYQQALSVWAPLAQEGNADAQYHLGMMFRDGYAVPVDRVRAYYWWEKASANGNEKAANSLAELEKTLTFLEKRQLQRVK